MWLFLASRILQILHEIAKIYLRKMKTNMKYNHFVCKTVSELLSFRKQWFYENSEINLHHMKIQEIIVKISESYSTVAHGLEI